MENPQKETIPAARGRGKELSSGELKMMLGQCLKMASENKITTNNTWGLPLIEHLDHLIREDDPTKHTNFQRASVTLDAGVKIYSYRVDSVHTETFKMLGGLGRASGAMDEEGKAYAGCLSPLRLRRSNNCVRISRAMGQGTERRTFLMIGKGLASPKRTQYAVLSYLGFSLCSMPPWVW